MKTKTALLLSACLFTVFVLWTIAVLFVDVQPIGPNGSCIGFAALNASFHNMTGTHMWLYTITDWLGLVPVAFCFVFALLGLLQWIRRRKILRVDANLLVLGGFYLAVLIAYLFFERFVVNYRPVLIDGFLEASYPSSTTLLVLCVMDTSLHQLRMRITRPFLKACVTLAICLFMAFMVLGRLICGVHWLSDIIGGILLSAALISAYRAVCNFHL